jgi:hypothetical protein
MIAGNERRTAHLSRRILDELYSGGPSPFDRPDHPMPWNSDLANAMLRFGPANSWINVADGESWPGHAVAWGLFGTPNYSFVPNRFAISDSGLQLTDFRIGAPIDSARERYRPHYDYVAELTEVQLAALPRGDSMLVAVIVDYSLEPIREVAPLSTMFFFTRAPDHIAAVAHASHGPSRVVDTVRLARADHLFSGEVLSDSVRVAGRARWMIRAPGAAMSDMLFFRPSATQPKSLEAALVIAAGRSFPRQEKLGVFWEMHGLEPGSRVNMELKIRALDTGSSRGTFAWLTRLLRGAKNSAERTVRWEVTGYSATKVAGYSVTIDLESLALGRHELTLTALLPGGEPASTSKELNVLRQRVAPTALVVALGQPLALARSGRFTAPPLTDGRTRVRGARPEERQLVEYFLDPLRPWCSAFERTSRWCERRADFEPGVRGGG